MKDGKRNCECQVMLSMVLLHLIDAFIAAVDPYLQTSLGQHFFFKYRPLSAGLPSQCIWSNFEFPFEAEQSRQRFLVHETFGS